MAILLLIDVHISPRVAQALRERGYDAVAVSEWHDGRFRTAPDDELLLTAHEDGRVFVTYDVRTVPVTLRSLAQARVAHSGVIFISQRTLRSDDIGGLVRALEKVITQVSADDLHSQYRFLSR